MLRVILRTIGPAAALSLVAAACGSVDTAGVGDDTIEVVATFFPLAEAAERIGGDAVTVTNLTPPGVEPHDLELTPDDMQTISRADVVLTLGGGFQPAVEEAVEAGATGTVVDLLDAVPLDARIEGDPHVWLDPSLYGALAGGVADALSDAGATDLDGRRSAFDAELTQLDAAFAEGLANCDHRLMLVNHEAFGYLAAAYDLEQTAISGLAPEAEPDPERLAELAALVRDEGVTTVFTESLVSPAVAETLAAEAGISTAVLNPLEGLTAEQAEAGEGYVSVMRSNLEALRDGLGCD
jgi:zinc transport system substrate-binding protein